MFEHFQIAVTILLLLTVYLNLMNHHPLVLIGIFLQSKILNQFHVSLEYFFPFRINAYIFLNSSLFSLSSAGTSLLHQYLFEIQHTGWSTILLWKLTSFLFHFFSTNYYTHQNSKIACLDFTLLFPFMLQLHHFSTFKIFP